MTVGEDWLAQMQADGGRVTAPRKAVVDILADSDRAMDPSEIYERARERHPAMGLVTVYRTLETSAGSFRTRSNASSIASATMRSAGSP